VIQVVRPEIIHTEVQDKAERLQLVELVEHPGVPVVVLVEMEL
jgi:hypothetical protein